VPWLALLVLAARQRARLLVVGSTEAITARPELRAEQGSLNRFGRRIGRRELDRAGLKRVTSPKRAIPFTRKDEFDSPDLVP
jgi:hypothetical protein